jgi:hypothetical protein
MEATAAIKLAKEQLSSLFATEGVSELQLEEVERKRNGNWLVTISFLRASRARPAAPGTLASYLPPDWQRESRVVEIDTDGNILAVTSLKRLSA